MNPMIHQMSKILIGIIIFIVSMILMVIPIAALIIAIQSNFKVTTEAIVATIIVFKLSIALLGYLIIKILDYVHNIRHI